MPMNMGIHRKPTRWQKNSVMTMNMSIHRKPTGRGDLAFLDSRLRGMTGGCSFSETTLML